MNRHIHVPVGEKLIVAGTWLAGVLNLADVLRDVFSLFAVILGSIYTAIRIFEWFLRKRRREESE